MAVSQSDRVHPLSLARALIEALAYQSQTLTSYGEALHTLLHIRTLDAPRRERLQDLLHAGLSRTDHDLRTSAVMLDVILSHLAPDPARRPTKAIRNLLSALNVLTEEYAAFGYAIHLPPNVGEGPFPEPMDKPTEPILPTLSREAWAVFVQNRFSLSESKANVVGHLMTGANLEDIAAREDKALETVRAQVKSARHQVGRALNRRISSAGYLVAAVLQARMQVMAAYTARLEARLPPS